MVEVTKAHKHGMYKTAGFKSLCIMFNNKVFAKANRPMADKHN